MTESKRFRWGVGTSAYQIEGAWHEEGKGESIWDRFFHRSGLMPNGDEACDHFHQLDDDLDILASMGVDSYRFSTAWTRVLPAGVGRTNAAGLAFYDRLVDGLLARGIEPWLTLYHWDLPQALQDAGGWPARESVDWFAEYASVMADHFGDRVSQWITINEPWVSSFLGHADGIFAPGTTNFSDALRCGHHQLLAHAEAVRIIRKTVPGAEVGIALDCRPAIPASRSTVDTEATMHFDGFRNRWFFDPVFGKGYPQDMVDVYTNDGRLPNDMIQPGDEASIAEPVDFCGVNYYTSIRIDSESAELDQSEGPIGAPAAPGYTEMGWRIDPDAFGDFLRRVDAEWNPPSIVVTENGASFSDGVGSDGLVHDAKRIGYLRDHISQIALLRQEGLPIGGYFLWSFMDNLEWVSGFDQRFGVVHVDHSTQHRVIKDSGLWYKDRIAEGIGGLAD